MRYNTLSFKPCVICLCRGEDLIHCSKILHAFFDMYGHLFYNSSVLIKGHACAAVEGFWNLLVYLYEGLIFASNDLQAFASLLTAWRVGISLPSSSKYLFSQSGQNPSNSCSKGRGQGMLTNIIQTSGSSSCW